MTSPITISSLGERGPSLTWINSPSGRFLYFLKITDPIGEGVAGAGEAGPRENRQWKSRRSATFETLTRQVTLSRATGAPRSVQRAAAWCLDRIHLVKKVRLVGVRLSRLERSPEHCGRAKDRRAAAFSARHELH